MHFNITAIIGDVFTNLLINETDLFIVFSWSTNTINIFTVKDYHNTFAIKRM